MLALPGTMWGKACGQGIGAIDELHQAHENIVDNTVLLETKFRTASLVFFRTLLLQEICKIPDQVQAKCSAYLDHKYLAQVLGCARSCLTAVPNQK